MTYKVLVFFLSDPQHLAFLDVYLSFFRFCPHTDDYRVFVMVLVLYSRSLIIL